MAKQLTQRDIRTSIVDMNELRDLRRACSSPTLPSAWPAIDSRRAPLGADAIEAINEDQLVTPTDRLLLRARFPEPARRRLPRGSQSVVTAASATVRVQSQPSRHPPVRSGTYVMRRQRPPTWTAMKQRARPGMLIALIVIIAGVLAVSVSVSGPDLAVANAPVRVA
jgi:hypothetical protein